MRMTSMPDFPDTSQTGIDLAEAARQLELAVHDAQVAYDCMGLGNLDRAHTYAITARTAADAAETILRAALNANANLPSTG
jgi:hypothetical protein